MPECQKERHGKPRLELIPGRLWTRIAKDYSSPSSSIVDQADWYLTAWFEQRDEGALAWAVDYIADCDSISAGDMVDVMEAGAAKYTDFDWLRGGRASVFVGAARRHRLSALRGEEKDADGLKHLACYAANLVFLESWRDAGTLIDDRPTYGTQNDPPAEEG
ncbi:MAG: hypothetical protein GWN58_58520 [Anaerolineae bacterium]|nr:hypothetical protein [Anaerolineae bacterium]